MIVSLSVKMIHQLIISALIQQFRKKTIQLNEIAENKKLLIDYLRRFTETLQRENISRHHLMLGNL